MAARPTKTAKRPGKGDVITTTKFKRTRGGTSTPGLSATQWHEKPTETVYQDLFTHVRNIKNRQVRRRYELALFQQYYCNNIQNSFAASGGLFASTWNNLLSSYKRLSANVIKSCTDTATARIAKGKPRAFVLPSKGSYRLKRKARKLTQFLDGSMAASGFYAGSEEVFRDGGIYGDGNIGIFPRNGEVKAIPLKIDEVIIDAVDGMYNDPREIFWEHPTPRSELLEEFPEFAEQINEARFSWRGDMAFMGQQDLVMVIHAWRKLAPNGGNGEGTRHVVAICNATLKDEPWKKDYLPILRWHWTPPTYGPFGMGIALELEGKQAVITNIMRDIAESIRMFAVPRVWLDALSQTSRHTLTNEIGVNVYSGNPPVFSTPAAMAADVYQFLQWLIDDCYKELGLSQLTAQSEKPAGLNSGIAMRTYQDVETQRFAIVGQRWERFYMEAARVHIDTAEDLYKDKGTLAVNVAGRGFIETVDWADASLKKDQYDVQVWPTNIMPESPEGKIQMAQELTNSGFMPKDVALSQMRMPIMNDWIDQETAARDNIERCLSAILERGKYIAPDPISDTALAVKLAQSAYLIAQDEEVEPHKTDMLLRWLNRAMELDAAAKAPPMSPMGPGAPPGGGGPVVGQAPAPPPAPMAAQGAGPVTMPAAA